MSARRLFILEVIVATLALLLLARVAVGQAPRQTSQAPRPATYGRSPEGVVLPDARVTPGAANAALTKEVLCGKGFSTKTVRNVTRAMKQQVCAAYGVTKDCPGTAVEIDHLIPLTVGGSNDLANLWPQPYGVPGAHQKDILENWLHGQVCSGKMTLAAAQHQIATNWFALYRQKYPAAKLPAGAR